MLRITFGFQQNIDKVRNMLIVKMVQIQKNPNIPDDVQRPKVLLGETVLVDNEREEGEWHADQNGESGIEHGSEKVGETWA